MKLYFLLITVFLSCKSSIFKNKIHIILDVKKSTLKHAQGSQEYGGRASSYVMEVYDISNIGIQEFLNKKLKTLPFDSTSTNIWTGKIDWSQTPVDSSDNKIIKRAFYYSGKIEVEKIIDEVEIMLFDTGSYYASYYQIHPVKYGKGFHVQDVQFFLINPKLNKVYILWSDN